MITLGGTYFDREGHEISMEEWARLGALPGYRRLLSHSVGTAFVATVWLGMRANLSWDRENPLIFETTAFFEGIYNQDYDWQFRYPTEEQARRGHLEMVDLVASYLKKNGQDAEIRQVDTE